MRRFEDPGFVPESIHEPIPADDLFLLKLYEILETHLTNAGFSIEQLADELAFSSQTLHRKLSTLTGSNANELIGT